MSRALDDLCPRLRPIAFEALARMVERKLAPMVIDTLRTHAEQMQNLANGVSATKNSLHLPQTDCPTCKGLSHAFDVAPYAVYQLAGPDKLQWDAADPAWKVIGEIAEMLGLEWGGRWKKPKDPGHIQLPRGV